MRDERKIVARDENFKVELEQNQGGASAAATQAASRRGEIKRGFCGSMARGPRPSICRLGGTTAHWAAGLRHWRSGLACLVSGRRLSQAICTSMSLMGATSSGATSSISSGSPEPGDPNPPSASARIDFGRPDLAIGIGFHFSWQQAILTSSSF